MVIQRKGTQNGPQALHRKLKIYLYDIRGSNIVLSSGVWGLRFFIERILALILATSKRKSISNFE
jgi:hypothetical protein